MEPILAELRRVGVRARLKPGRGATPDRLVIRPVGGGELIFAIERRARAPYPNEIRALENRRRALIATGAPLLIAPFVSEPQGNVLMQTGWSWADDQGNFDLAAGTLRLRQRRTAQRPRERGTFPGGEIGFAIVRALISFPRYFQERLTQQRLARAVETSQARVSQVIGQLRGHDLVRGGTGRWEPDRAALLDAFLDNYRGPGGEEEHWYTLDDPSAAALALVGGARGRVAVSADVGPDLLAPHRRPTHLIVYVDSPARGVDLGGLVQARGSGDANVILRRPTDGGVFGPRGLQVVATLKDVPLRLADPAQMVWDLLQLGGDDRAEAAQGLRKWILGTR